MEDEINAGLIGLGKMGMLHMGILNASNGVKVNAIAESQKFIKMVIKNVLPASKIYDNYEDMLDKEDLDFVYITTPTSLHATMAKSCMERGINFFVEKPLGVSGKECESLVAITGNRANQKQTINMVGYCKHFIETFIKAKEILDSEILGDLTYLTSHMFVSQLFSKGSGWRYKKEVSGGGVLNILATHLVDVLLWFFGDINSVNSNIKSYYSKDVEDFVHSYLIFKSGLEGYLDASWSIRNYRLPEIKIEVQGAKGMLVVTEDYVKYFLDADNKFYVFYKQDLYNGVEIDVGGPEYTREDKHFIDCVRNKKNTELNILYGYKVQCVTDAIYESANKKEAVLVSYRGL